MGRSLRWDVSAWLRTQTRNTRVRKEGKQANNNKKRSKGKKGRAAHRAAHRGTEQKARSTLPQDAETSEGNHRDQLTGPGRVHKSSRIPRTTIRRWCAPAGSSRSLADDDPVQVCSTCWPPSRPSPLEKQTEPSQQRRHCGSRTPRFVLGNEHLNPADLLTVKLKCICLCDSPGSANFQTSWHR